MKNKIVFFALIFSLAVSFSSCKKERVKNPATNAISVTDYAGRIVSLEKPAKNVVAMAANALFVLASLDCLDTLCALDTKSHKLLPMSVANEIRPDLKNLSDVGKTSSPDAEAILLLNPDLVLFSGNAKDATALQEKTGAQVAVIKSIDGFDFEIYRVIGKLLGKEKRADEVISLLKNKMNFLSEKLRSVDDEKSAYLVLQSASGLYKTMKSNQSLQLARIKNIASGSENVDEWGFAQFSKEALLQANPDFIFLDKPLGASDITKQTLKSDENFSAVNAVKNDKIFTMQSFSFPKDYVFVIAQSFYFARIVYPEKISFDDYKNAVNDLFFGADGLEGYFDEFEKCVSE